MLRRQLLQLAAVLPFTPAVVLPEPEPVVPVEPEKVVIPFNAEVEWQAMAFKLWQNYEAYEEESLAKGIPAAVEDERRFLQAVTYRTCRHLLSESQDVFSGRDMAAAYDPLYPHSHDKTVFDQVRYRVIDHKTKGTWIRYQGLKQSGGTEPSWMLDNTSFGRLPKPKFRKLRARWNPELVQDLQALHGFDAEVEMCEIIAQQLALEIQCEIRKDFRDGNPVDIYGLHIPLTVTKSFLNPKDFSVRRGLLMSYSKLFAKNNVHGA